MYIVQITMKIFIHFVKKKRKKKVGKNNLKKEGVHRMKMQLKIFIKLQRTLFRFQKNNTLTTKNEFKKKRKCPFTLSLIHNIILMCKMYPN